jgi:hypothetical protein
MACSIALEWSAAADPRSISHARTISATSMAAAISSVVRRRPPEAGSGAGLYFASVVAVPHR